jgi:hypothetical protein
MRWLSVEVVLAEIVTIQSAQIAAAVGLEGLWLQQIITLRLPLTILLWEPVVLLKMLKAVALQLLTRFTQQAVVLVVLD